MIDPKFANLPYIAHDQPDVFETSELMESNETEFYEEEPENESIEKLKINTHDSYNRFKGKYLIGNVDFSDNIGRKRCIGYNAVSGNYEIVGEGEKENPIQKCQRLQVEMNELMDEIVHIQNDQSVSKEERESYEAVSNVVSTAKKLLESLRLEQVLGNEAVATTADKQVKNLITQVEEYKKSGPTTVDLLKQKSQNELAYTTRIAELEHKIHRVEQIVGAKPDKISRLNNSLGTSNLLEAVHQLSTKSALLQPTQLDLIEQRLTNLSTKMDSFAEKTGGTGESLRDQKIIELYELAKSSEPITKILPDMLERMHTLEALHSYAANFSKLFAELQETQAVILKGIAGNKDLLQGVQHAFAENYENVNKEIAKLEEGLKKLEKK